jgi:hypothetical protein
VYVPQKYLAKSTSWRHAIKIVLESDEKLLIVEVMHGMCNRIRAYASAAVIARKSHRRMVLVWKPDVHTGARFSDLFDLSSSSVIVSEDDVLAYVQSFGRSTEHYDYMNSTEKGALIVTKTIKHIYVRSSFELSSDTQYSEMELRSAYHEISRHISSSVREHLSALMQRKIQGTSMIGAHVRMLADLKVDIPGINKLKKSSVNGLGLMYEAEKYRRQCHVRYFVPHIQNALDKFPRSIIFIASDSQEAIDVVNDSFARMSTVVHTDISKLLRCRGVDRRGPFCSQLALSEFLFLATSDVLLTSTWSSTTDLLLRLHDGEHGSGCAESLG